MGKMVIHYEGMICMDFVTDEGQFKGVNNYVRNDLTNDIEEVLRDKFYMNHENLSVFKQNTRAWRLPEPPKEEQQ